MKSTKPKSKPKSKPEYFFWACGPDDKTAYQREDIRPGTVLRCRGNLKPCHNGLHASPTPWDCLRYNDGPVLWLVRLSAERQARGS